MTFDHLLAKSWDRQESTLPPDECHLVAHLTDVAEAGDAICQSRGQAILGNLRLEASDWGNRLRRALRVACILHDIGKANSAFQRLVRGQLEASCQPARHELLSVIVLLECDALKEWALAQLQAANPKEEHLLFNAVVGAIAGHHVKMDQAWIKAARGVTQGGCGTEVSLLLGHPDLADLFPESVALQDKALSLVKDHADYLGRRRQQFVLSHLKWQKALGQDREWRSFAAALKGLVMAADAAGSALLAREIDVGEWVRMALCTYLDAGDGHRVAHERLGSHKPRDFQRAIAESQARVTMVEAGCGTGKTVAAYLWAETHAVARTLFFCYPTTGTATEGFLGYVHETDVEAALIHSRAAVDLEGLRLAGDEDSDEAPVRLASLRAWGPKVVVCTVDTVLALARSNRRGLYNSPAILSGAFVFDEVHSYSPQMFGAMLALMDALAGAKFLLMSASLPNEKRQALLSRIPGIVSVRSPRDLEALPRYRFRRAESVDEAWRCACSASRGGKRVLWISNTVNRTQGVYDRGLDSGLPVATYHSRFKYVDRVARHRAVIDAFDHERGFLASTTQVAEMSLDLDADVLITEVAPIPALIQRLGRLNRRITPDRPGCPREAWFVPLDGSPLPYTQAELDLASQWLDELAARHDPLSQRDLAEAFQSIHHPDPSDIDTRTEWLDSGWLAEPGPVREPGLSVRVILEADRPTCQADRSSFVRLCIPLNFDERRGMGEWPELLGHLVAPSGAIQYDPERGASWPKK